MRRKGERPVVTSWPPYGLGHPVARMIAQGDRWLQAWTMQSCVPYERLAKRTGLSMERIFAIEQGSTLTLAEMQALADAWKADLTSVIASLPDRSLLVP
jgi:transcriptional regulator with XRE-family HTH domain